MRKISLLTVLSLSTVLTACGGGGSGSGNVPVTTLPTVTKNETTTSMTTSSFSNADKRDALVAYANENAEQTVSATTGLAQAQSLSLMNTAEEITVQTNSTSTQDAFNTMKEMFLGKERNWNNYTGLEIQKALFLMGFKKEDLPTNYTLNEEWRNWCEINSVMIKEKAQQAWDMYGEEHTVSLENAQLTSVSINTQKQDSLYHFVVDQNGQITKLIANLESTSSSSRQMTFDYDKEKNLFVYTGKSYTVEFPINYTENDKTYNFSLEIELVNEVTEENFEELKKRLIAKLYEKQEEGKDLPENLVNLAQKIRNLDYQTDFKVKIINDEKEEGYNNAVHYYVSNGDPVYMSYQSYGKKVGQKGLQYSDFGVTEIVDGTNSTGNKIESADVFAGGYDIKRIDKSKLSDQTMTFTGKAVATALYQKDGDESVAQREESSKIYDNGTAQLVFNKGKENLTADFTDAGWYKILVESNADNTSQYDITFTGGDKIEGSGYSDYKFNNDTSYKQENIVGYTKFENDEDRTRYGTVDIGYYGDDNTPSESTGYVTYGEELSDNKGGADSLHIQIGFGTVRQ